MEFGELIRYVVLTLIAFFVAAPIFLSTIGKFTVQKRFAILMVNEKVISEGQYKSTIKTQQIVGTFFSLLIIVVLIISGIKFGIYGWLCIIAGLLIGGFKQRRQVQYTSETVKSFKRLFVNEYDKEKLNDFIEKNF